MLAKLTSTLQRFVRRTGYSLLLSIAASVLAGALTLVATFWIEPRPRGDSTVSASLDSRVSRVESSVAAVEEELASIRALVAEATDPGNLGSLPVAVLARDVEVLKQDVEEAGITVRSLQELLISDPERALDTALLQRDLAEMKASLDVSEQELREDIRAVRSTWSWLIGIIFTLVVAIVGILVTLLLRLGRSPSDPSTPASDSARSQEGR